MPFRLFTLLAAVLLLGACSTTDDAAMDDQGMAGDSMTSEGPLSDIYGEQVQGAEPGTQADLVENVGDRVFFGYDRYDVSGEAQQTLQQQAQWLQQYPNLNIVVEGHADERGTREYNLALGERRANSAKNYLVSQGVDPRRITTISYGKERPAVVGSDSSSWAQNRRAVTVVQ